VSDTAASGRLAIDDVRHAEHADAATVDAFLADRASPIIEGDRATFVFRGEADEVALIHWIVGLSNRIPLQRVDGTDLWYVVIELPAGSRVEYKLDIRRGDHSEWIDDPRNPNVSHNPFGTNSAAYGRGYATPEWARPDPEARPGTLTDLVVPSNALERDAHVTLYLPARFRRRTHYPLLVVHDGGDYLQYSAAKTVLDNLIHRLDMAEVIVAFTHPGDRLVEYPNNAAHARYIASELLPKLEADLPLIAQPAARCLMGASFGAVASLSTAVWYPDVFGSLVLQSGSFVFTDIGSDHGGGPAFDPVVDFVNAYRAHPLRVADRLFVTCGMYEPLIVPNRSMVPTFQAAGMEVRYVEARDGHNWENWRDRLREGLSWIYPGPQKLVYE
jgi:enterochelin esterase-like enzyme